MKPASKISQPIRSHFAHFAHFAPIATTKTLPPHILKMMFTLEHNLLLAVRFFLALQNSYIHPDEHFQTFQIADHMLGSSGSQIPWEFTTRSRSLIPIYLVYYPIVKFSRTYTTLSNLQILYLTRVLFCIVSWLVIDSFILQSNKKKILVKRSSYSISLLIYSSYVISTYQSHTFSNSIETLLLILSLSIITDLKHSSIQQDKGTASAVSSSKLISLALIIVFATFNRITFPAFLLLPSYYILTYFIVFKFSANSLWPTIRFRHFLQLLLFAGCILTFIYAFIIIDTSLYAKYFPNSDNANDHLVISCWNNFKYNSNLENLKIHGIHKRYTHVLINLPQMLGPIFLIFLIKLKTFAFFIIIQFNKNVLNRLSSSSNSKPASRSNKLLAGLKSFISNTCQINSHQYLDIDNKDICYLSIISSLSILSFFPHQELRFLIPLQPLILNIIDFWFLNEKTLSVHKTDQEKHSGGNNKKDITNNNDSPVSAIYTVTPSVKKLVHNILLTWYIFNFIMALLMGVFHQAGVITVLDYFNTNSSTAHFSSIDSNNKSIQIWWRNYSPPTWMLSSSSNNNNSSTIVNYHIIPYENSTTSSLLKITDSQIPEFEITDSTDNDQKNVMVLDVMGMKSSQLLDLFTLIKNPRNMNENGEVTDINLICPCSSVDSLLNPLINDDMDNQSKKFFTFEKVFKDWIHLNMDHFELGICVYSVTSSF